MRRIAEFLTSARSPWLFAAAMAFCMSVVAIWYGGLNQDEGWYLYAAQMVRAGKLPYRDFFYTQGPAMPFVYALLSPIWGMGSPFHGLLGGRLVTLLLGLLATGSAMALVRQLVPSDRRSLAGMAVFALLGCNLYHLYFTTIPKTYSLGSLFLLAGLWLITLGLRRPSRRLTGPALLVAGGLLLAFATGTRISLLLVLPVVGFTLLAKCRLFRWSFLWFGLGGALGLFLVYGFFALDPASLKGLLAAQNYHAARGGFDSFFAIGSVSRLSRGYAALGVILFAWVFLSLRRGEQTGEASGEPCLEPAQVAMMWILGLGFASVFLLQLSAPFPYDDYQVPIMGMLTVLIVAVFSRGAQRQVPSMWFVALVAGLVSFASPMLQEWATYNQDRFWSQKKEMTELAKLRQMGRELQTIDPEGTTLLTQDLYLAVETGRTVPSGLEMGPFSYFPDMETEDAKAVHVLNRELMTKLLESAPCSAAACSGYAFAIAVPKCTEVPFKEQTRYFDILKKNYELKDAEANFGQNATTLLIMKRKPGKGRVE